MTTEVKTHCKFCGKEIIVPHSEEWGHVGRQISNLLNLVCCNPCAQARETLRQTSFDIRDCCQKWGRLSVTMRDQVASNVRLRLGRLTADHMAALAKIRGQPEPDHDPAIVSQLMDRPERWFETLKDAHRMVSNDRTKSVQSAPGRF